MMIIKAFFGIMVGLTVVSHASVNPNQNPYYYGVTAMTDINYSSYPATRAEALLVGEKYYFTGRPCKRGHVAPRMACNHCCYECVKIKARKDYYKDLEKNRKRSRDYQASLPREELERRWKEQRIKHAKRISEYGKKYIEKNRDRINKYRRERIKKDGDRINKVRREWASRTGWNKSNYYKNRDSIRAAQAKARKENNEHYLKRDKGYREKYRERRLRQKRLSYVFDRERHLNKSREYRLNNPEKRKQQWDQWYSKNAHRAKFLNERRANRLKSATPEWSDLERVSEIYLKAKRMQRKDGIERHVDHIIPLRHELVCGLHVPDNLQILTAEENLAKGNKFEIS